MLVESPLCGMYRLIAACLEISVVKIKTMKTIIVPTDFSTTSNNAVNYAVGLGREINCSILLFHAYQVPVSMTDVPIVLISVEDLQKNAETKMAEEKKSLEQTAGGA